MSDGVGSKRNSHIGSREIVRSLYKVVKETETLNTDNINTFVERVHQHWIHKFKNFDRQSINCTVLAIVVFPNIAIQLQIGDGLNLMIANQQVYLFPNIDLEFSNVSHSISGKLNLSNWRVNFVHAKYNEIKFLLATDGFSDDIKEDMYFEIYKRLYIELNKVTKKTRNKLLTNVLIDWGKNGSNDDKTILMMM